MIEVVNLKKSFKSRGVAGTVQALRDVSFQIPVAGAISFVGESGCGKTTIGRILCGYEEPTEGMILWHGQDVFKMKPKVRKEVFQKVQLIHQDPFQALNPARTIEQSLVDPLKVMAKQHGRSTSWVYERAIEVLTLVGLDPATVMYKYPHMLSGGQRQRIVIARALTVEPEVLVADEAVSMIDVSLRLGILKLLQDLRANLKISLLFIAHDVAAARYIGDDGVIYVIYKGLVVEKGLTEKLIQRPEHPYTQALFSAVPVLKGLEKPGPDRYIPLKEIDRNEPNKGCLFAPRCPFAQAKCLEEVPQLSGADHDYACHFPEVRYVTAIPTGKY